MTGIGNIVKCKFCGALYRVYVGAKPERFCRWLADLLGYIDGEDVLDDLFPGTGVMGQTLSQGTLDVIS